MWPMSTDNETGLWASTVMAGQNSLSPGALRLPVENGTHVLFGTRMGAYRAWEPALAEETLPFLKRGMACLADRNFFRYCLVEQSRHRDDLLWRAKKTIIFPVK